MNKGKYIKDIIEYLRIKEREYLERNVMNDNNVGGFAILGSMVQNGDMNLSQALQIYPAIQDPYSDYTIEVI